MAWVTPKTNWVAGDYFNASDYNRIKNNLAHLRDMAIALYPTFDILPVSNDKSIGDFFYVDEINAMEMNLETINTHTMNQDYGTTPSYADNDRMPRYVEFNRLESATLSLYSLLTNQKEGQHHFEWNFGIGGMF